ncbi:hypothetical protein MJG53_008715 [Ovis ammon polii x Ovis aries]|uniref:Uncharacterized protein n=1 Tax=Ovis ammon polii x Ovis aries TaxID=2918886 RepID=A0ACB9V0T7_9CETA|nr:hypothetical protein MJG53_008715 [Ovis ammon polii x Ovis aries]
MDWRSLERTFFLSRSVLWASFIYVFTYLPFFFFFFFWWRGGRMGVLSQNSDFINHLLGCRSLCSKLKKKQNNLHGAPVLLSKMAESPNLQERIVQRSLRICRLADLPWNSSGSQV